MDNKQQIDSMNLDGIPQELKGLPNWVAWKVEIRNGKETKIPVNARTGKNAESTNPGTWGTFQEAVNFWSERNGNGAKGIGFVFCGKAGFCGIDLDGCRDRENGEIEPWAYQIVAKMKTYTEITPSGRGLHIWTRGTLPEDGRRKGKIEMYDRGRYFTITGRHLEGTPATIEARQKELEEIHSKIFTKPVAKTRRASQTRGKNDLADSDLFEKAKAAGNGDKFARLWAGDWNGHPSQSEADLALVSMLAFWTGRDPERMDNFFRQSGLMREKWNERHGAKTYGEMTIDKAIEQTTEVYSPCKVAPTIVIEVGINLTDLGNARRFVIAHSKDLRFCYPWAKWLAWDGQRWKVDDTREIYRRAKDTIRIMYREAGEANEEKQRKLLGSHALRSESDSKIKAMLSLAQSEPGIPILPDDMDKNPWILNVVNGTIDLKTGELKPHRREDLITRLAPVEYRLDGECPFWLEHLDKIFQKNAGVISFLQLAFGYSLTGITDERALFIAYGAGANGKTTTHEIFSQILGDYAVRTPTESILVKRDGGIPNDLAKLKGARFVYCSEVEEGKRLAESLIKDLTGNDTISARFMRAEWFSFQPSFKLWLATNHKPVIRGTDNAIWSRIRLIPFTVSIPEDERIPRSRMMERLAPELPGILAWGVTGCLDWLKYGLGMPDEVREATESYRGEMDILGGFIGECCIVSGNAQGTAKELYENYVRWAEKSGEKSVSQRMFGLRLAERGFRQKRNSVGRIEWTGIGLESILESNTEP